MDAAAIWIPIVVVAVLVVLFGLYLLAAYQSLVGLRARVDEAWRDIAGQLRRRADLIPELVETVRGYATHDANVFQAVTVARAETLSASDPAKASAAENHLQQALRGVFTVAEAYPQLQASQRFLGLQGGLGETEDGIQASRRFYNGGVRELNTKIQVFPGNLLARRMGLRGREFFEVAEGTGVAQPPRIQF